MIRLRDIASRRGGVVFILSAPSGAGKTTLIHRLMSLFPEITLSVSYTTRGRRGKEVHGRDYYFVTEKRFTEMIQKDAFAEWAKVHGFFYGTPRRALDRILGRGGDVLLDIDVQGAEQVKRKYPQAVSIFLIPPSWKELKRRLSLRGTDQKETIQKRLENARREIRQIMKYDYYIVNRELGEALEALKSIVIAERSKVSRIRGANAGFVRKNHE